jgi:Domain of unknown function (DUF4112)
MAPRTQKLARALATWLDNRYLDPVIGLVLPEVGDLLTTLAGLVVVASGWQEGVRLPTLARMLLNLAIDGIVGAVPVLGDLFDFVWKAHSKNAALLEAPETQTTVKDWLVLGAALLGVLVALALPIWALIALLRYLTSMA